MLGRGTRRISMQDINKPKKVEKKAKFTKKDKETKFTKKVRKTT